jgi:hypothetical protein
MPAREVGIPQSVRLRIVIARRVVRGRQIGAALGREPTEAVRIIAARVIPLVERATDDAVVGTPWGGMRLIDYLPTRVFELSVHTLDLAAALAIETHVSDSSSAVTWELIAHLARRGGSENDVLRATTGQSRRLQPETRASTVRSCIR